MLTVIGCRLPALERRHMGLWDDFTKIVHRYFEYLETDFGFRRVSARVPFVVYDSAFLRIRIYYDISGRQELDLGIEPFERIDKLGRDFGIGRLIRLHDTAGGGKFRVSYPSTSEELEVSVAELANLLKRYGSNILGGDLRDLRCLAELEEELEEKYSHGITRQDEPVSDH